MSDTDPYPALSEPAAAGSFPPHMPEVGNSPGWRPIGSDRGLLRRDGAWIAPRDPAGERWEAQAPPPSKANFRYCSCCGSPLKSAAQARALIDAIWPLPPPETSS